MDVVAPVAADIPLEKEPMESCVAFVSDQRYLPLMMAAATTAVTRSSFSFPVAVLGFDVAAPVKRDVCAYFRDLGRDIEFIDHDEKALGLDWGRLPVKLADMSKAAYGRLALPELLAHHHSVLYMDGDMLVDADLAELTQNPPAGVAAVEAIHHIDQVPKLYRLNPDLRRRRSYFNSGLFYVNTGYWREVGGGRQVIDLIASDSVKTPLHDQDYLNVCFGDSYQRLDIRWNFTWPMSYIVPRLRPFIIHFAGRLKPWDSAEWRCPAQLSAAYGRLLRALPASVRVSLPELGYQGWDRRRLRRQRLLALAGAYRGARWNRRHAGVLDGWCA